MQPLLLSRIGAINGISWISSSTPTGLLLLATAFVLTSTIGLERQYRLKAAGFRTHALVGIGSTLFTLVSVYGFGNADAASAPIDPSRVAAQIVSGIGFLGAGVIFVRRNSISGLTTAASIWVTASIGMACGAGLPLIGLATTILYLLTVGPLGKIAHLFHSPIPKNRLIVRYQEGLGALRRTLSLAIERGYEAVLTDTRGIGRQNSSPCYEAVITLTARPGTIADPLLDDIAEIPGVISARLAAVDVD
ncbi:MgtC/SapB family protein [Arcanobacterium haemolyticum]|nr:MgtC/SapB family protein [Arcanobacterium haemolyticum]